MATPLISICVPSYERIEYLERLFKSIEIQKFRDFEVIFTDDSKTDNVKIFLQNYHANFPLYYYKNRPSLGTAKNMVEGAIYARSQWIKIIHDDDFFASENALQQYANACLQDVQFIFSGYNEYHENTGAQKNKTISEQKFAALSKNPSVLFAHNLIGPPSVLMMHKDVKDVFDVSLKWFTDMEYYFRILGKEKSIYIDKPLVNVSYNDTQVTNYTRTNASVVIPESLYLLNKHGVKIASNILAYDSWWRVFRNMDIRSVSDLEKYMDNIPIPLFVKKMIQHQKAIPQNLIRIGIVSKCSMTVSFILNKISRLI